MLLQCKLHFDLAFQSTLPRGERHFVFIVHSSYLPHFNPRSREGSDGMLQTAKPDQSTISIHAPARGATHSQMHFEWKDIRFQSTLPRGERLFSVIHLCSLQDFNPRSREGSDGLHML